jgi:hypothetical protein
MQRAVIGLFLLPVGLLCGCAGSAPESPFVSPPHGGNIIGLPDSRGFVELKSLREPPVKGGSKMPLKSRIVAYFYQDDSTTAMSPAPADVKVTLGAGTGNVVSLSPESAEPGQFASKPGDYPDALRGNMEFTLDGKPVQLTFTFR